MVLQGEDLGKGTEKELVLCGAASRKGTEKRSKRLLTS